MSNFRYEEKAAIVRPANQARSTAARSTEEWRALDAAHHIHPFSDMGALNQAGSRVITKASGVYIWDSEGNKIIDGMAGLWCVNAGYGRMELADAAYRQLQDLSFYNTFFKTTHPPIIELSALLSEITPAPFNKFFYCNSGSEGNDTVLRIVYQFWLAQGRASKKVVISRKNGYGGDLSPAQFGLRCAQELETKILELGAENVAAFIGEPFQGAGGVIFPPETYWPEIQRICRKYDVLLCADEVIGGFGRTGHWFAHQYFGFEPDLITLAKGLTSGYIPMGAVGMHDRVAKVISESGDFNHGLTYSGHPVAAAVAVANLKLLRDDGIVDRVRHDTGPYFQKALRDALEDNPIVGEISGTGFVAGIQLAQDKATRKRFENGGEVGMICRDFSFNNNLIMRASGDRMLLSPPLVMTRSEIDEMVAKAKYAIELTAKRIGYA